MSETAPLTTRDKVIHVAMMVLPIALGMLIYFWPTSAPHWIASAGGVGLVLVAIVNRSALPPWAKAALSQAEDALNAAGQPGLMQKIVARAKGKLPPIAVAVLFGVFAGLPRGDAAMRARMPMPSVALEGCHATPAQIEQTFVDGLKDAGCILANVFAGIVDPMALLGSCGAATEQVIVDAIDDFYAKAPAPSADGGTMGVAPGMWRAGVTLEQKKNCDTARAYAVAAIAAKSGKGI